MGSTHQLHLWRTKMSHFRSSPQKQTQAFTQVQGEYGCKTFPHQRALGPFHNPSLPHQGRAPHRRSEGILSPLAVSASGKTCVFHNRHADCPRSLPLQALSKDQDQDEDQSQHHTSARSHPARIWILERCSPPLLSVPHSTRENSGNVTSHEGKWQLPPIIQWG